MKYFVYGYYGFGNYGDDLLLAVLLARIRVADPGASFVIRARSPVSALAEDPQVRFLLAEGILEDHSHKRISRFYRYLKALCTEARDCDFFVIGGGTLFIDKGKLNWSLLFLYAAVRSAKRNHRQVVISGVAIDIMANPLSLWFTREIFKLANFAAVRDTLSLAYFQDREVPPCLAADLVWLKPHPVVSRTPRSRQVVGLNFIDYYRTSSPSVEGHEALRKRLGNLIKQYREEIDFHLIALQKDVGQRDDWFLEEFRRIVPGGRISYIYDESTLSETLECVDAVITTRFHLALLAAQSGTPACIIDHELKLTSLAQDLMLPTIPLVDFVQGETALDPIQRLKSFDSEATMKVVAKIAKRAERNFDWLSR